jgi:4-azaleucine resistance transporter AzlC
MHVSSAADRSAGYGSGPATVTTNESVRAVRRQVLRDGVGIALSAAAFAMVYGLAAREAGMSVVETLAMSVIVFAGAAQFAAVGLIAAGAPWAAIVVLTALLNLRHLLYSAALAPWFAGTPRRIRAGTAHLLTDETFALVLPAFRALGRVDLRTYLTAGLIVAVPWVIGGAVGVIGGQLLPDPRSLALDVVFPAAMAGLAVPLVTERRSLVAAVAGGVIGVAAALALGATVGIVAGGVLGPLVALLMPRTSPTEPGGARTGALA